MPTEKYGEEKAVAYNTPKPANAAEATILKMKGGYSHDDGIV
jgi:hypothetical protein